MFIWVKALLSDSPPIQRYEPATQEINKQGIKRWSDHLASCSCLNGWLQVTLMITGGGAEKPFHRALQFHYNKHKNRPEQLNSVCNLTNYRSWYTTTVYQSSTCFNPSSNWFVRCVFQSVKLFDCITYSYENSATPASIQYEVKIFFCFVLRFGMDTLI
jgi:hypothetical protein